MPFICATEVGFLNEDGGELALYCSVYSYGCDYGTASFLQSESYRQRLKPQFT